MSEVNATGSVLDSYAIQPTTKNTDNELGQTAFLELMITQLEHQDPLSPQDNTEFVAQLAQFSSVESLDNLNTNFNAFSNNFVANQALQASSLVGRSVTVPATTTRLENDGIVSASVDLESSVGDLKMSIYNDSGSLVDVIDLGAQPAGELVLRWDGLKAELNGTLLDWAPSQEGGVAAGTYRFDATTFVDGKETVLDTALSANVNSVTVGQDGGLTLNLAGVGAVSLADVKQFNE